MYQQRSIQINIFFFWKPRTEKISLGSSCDILYSQNVQNVQNDQNESTETLTCIVYSYFNVPYTLEYLFSYGTHINSSGLNYKVAYCQLIRHI